MATAPEIRPLTGLRGVAALYVMAYHYTIGMGYATPGATLISHGYLAVDLFFCLSGFVMALRYAHMFEGTWHIADYLSFLGRRIARVYPLYFVATLLAFALVLADCLQPPVSRNVTLAQNLVLNLAMIQTWGFADSLDGAAWSVSAEWAAYLIFPLLLVLAVRSPRRYAWLTAGLCVTTIALLPALSGLAGDRITAHAPLDIFQPALALPVIRCLAEFTLGLIAYRIASAPAGRALSRSRWAAPAIVTATLAMLTLADTDAAIVMLFVACLIALSAEGNLPARGLSAPIAQLAGRLSYSVYLTHLLFGGLVSAIHDQVQTFGLAHAHGYGAAAGVLATLVTSLLLYKWIEVPARRALRRAFDRAGGASAEAGAAPSRMRMHD